MRGQLDREKAEFQEIAVQQHLVLEQHEATEAQLEGQLAAARQEVEQVSLWLMAGLCIWWCTPDSRCDWRVFGSGQAGADIGQPLHSRAGT